MYKAVTYSIQFHISFGKSLQPTKFNILAHAMPGFLCVHSLVCFHCTVFITKLKEFDRETDVTSKISWTKCLWEPCLGTKWRGLNISGRSWNPHQSVTWCLSTCCSTASLSAITCNLWHSGTNINTVFTCTEDSLYPTCFPSQNVCFSEWSKSRDKQSHTKSTGTWCSLQYATKRMLPIKQ